MSVLPVRLYGDPVLRGPTEPVGNIDTTIATLVRNMHATQAQQGGIGLAAPQVGLSRRLFVVDISSVERGSSPAVYINPEIIGTYGEVVDEEGCLSFPGIHLDVRRARQVGLRYLDLDGRERTLDADGLLARVVLHEFDHLEGRLFVDTLTEEARADVLILLREQGIYSSGP